MMIAVPNNLKMRVFLDIQEEDRFQQLFFNVKF